MSKSATGIVRTFLEALWAGETDNAKAQFSDESEWWFRPSLGYRRPMPGPDAIDIVFNDMIGRFDPDKPFNVDVHHIFGEDGEVAAEYTATGTTMTGREYKHRYLLRATVVDDKIRTVRPFVDTKYFLETLMED